MVYLTAIGQPPGGSSTVHIYTQTIDNNTKQYIEQHKNTQNNIKIQRTTQKLGRVRAVPRPCGFYPGICLTTQEKARKNLSQVKKTSVRVRRTSVSVRKTSVRVRKTSIRVRKTLVRVRKTSVRVRKTSVSHAGQRNVGYAFPHFIYKFLFGKSVLSMLCLTSKKPKFNSLKKTSIKHQ